MVEQVIFPSEKVKDMRSQYITEFNKGLIQLLSELEKYYPNSGEVIILNNRLRLLKNEVGRETLIEICGRAIYKYKEQIEKRDEEFFANFNNIKSISDLRENEGNYKLVSNVFRMALSCYNSITQKQKDEMFNKLKIMLNSYINYNMK